MSINTKLSDDGSSLVISIEGNFDFSLLNTFRQAYVENNEKQVKVIINMRKTLSIDSSALGMLLNMKKYLNKADGEIKIMNCNQVVKKVFHITNFNKKFAIE